MQYSNRKPTRISNSVNNSALSNYNSQLPALSPLKLDEAKVQLQTQMLLKGPTPRKPLLQYTQRDNSLLSIQNSNNNLHRKQFLPKDPETMREEAIQLKQTCNQLREQNRLLQAKLRLADPHQMTQSRDQSFYEGDTTHDKFKELSRQLEHKDLVIQELKRNNRTSRVQELEVELGSYKLETQRLMNIINQMTKAGTEDSTTVVQLLSAQLMDEELKNKDLTQKINGLHKRNSQHRWEITQLGQQRAQLKQQYQERCIEVQELKRGIEIRKTQRKDQVEILSQTVQQQQATIDHLTIRVEQLKEHLLQQQKQFRARWEMEEQLQLQYSHEHNKREIAASEQDELARTLEVRTKQVTEPSLQNEQPPPQQRRESSQASATRQESTPQQTVTQPDTEPHQTPVMKTIQRPESPVPTRPLETKLVTEPNRTFQNQRMPKVNGYDVEDLGRELRLRLMSRGVPQWQIDDLLTPNDEASIHELIETLEREPFLVQGFKQRQLLARYLVEDNTEEFITYDEFISADRNIIKSVFKKLVGRYTLFQDDEIKVVRKELQQIFTKYRNSFVDTIQMLIVKKRHLPKDSCEYEDLEGAFRFCDINCSLRQMEYINLVIYQQNGQIAVLLYKELLAHIFEQLEPPKQQTEKTDPDLAAYSDPDQEPTEQVEQPKRVDTPQQTQPPSTPSKQVESGGDPTTSQKGDRPGRLPTPQHDRPASKPKQLTQHSQQDEYKEDFES